MDGSCWSRPKPWHVSTFSQFGRSQLGEVDGKLRTNLGKSHQPWIMAQLGTAWRFVASALCLIKAMLVRSDLGGRPMKHLTYSMPIRMIKDG